MTNGNRMILKELDKKLNTKDGITQIPSQTPVKEAIKAILGLIDIDKSKIGINVSEEILTQYEIEFDKYATILDSLKYICSVFDLDMNISEKLIKVHNKSL